MRKKKILVVDDEPEFLTLIGEQLRANGYEVFLAADGTEGLQKAQQEIPNLILLDVVMPNMNGVDMLATLKRKSETRGIPVVMLTAKGETDMILQMQKMGAVDYFIKPFKPEELLAYIKRYIS